MCNFFISSYSMRYYKDSNLTTISRVQEIDGFSIPAIICNLQYHLTGLQVYRDGLIYCWEMVDLDLFRKKLNRNWVVPSIPDGEFFSAFSLGHCRVVNGNWLYNKQTYYKYIFSLVKELNPELENLYNCKGKTTELINNVNVSIFGGSKEKPYYIPDHKLFFNRVTGEKFFVFYKYEEKIYLTELSIFKDGQVVFSHLPKKIKCDFSQLQDLIHDNIVFTQVPDGEQINIFGLGSFTVIDGTFVNVADKYLEIKDKYNSFRGEEESLQRCIRIFREYIYEQTEAKKEALKHAYEAIPTHLRMFAGDMDSKDYPIRIIIYGEIAKQEWMDRYGFEYPYGDPIK